MGFLPQAFGPSKQEDSWRQFASVIGAEFVKGRFFGSDKVEAQVDDWTITLDTYEVGGHGVEGGSTPTTYTRMTAAYVANDGFRFETYRKGILSQLGKFLGMQDIQVGDPEFDRNFIVKGNDESKVRALFANSKIRQLIQSQRSIHLQVKRDKLDRFREGFPVLHFEEEGVITDVERLRSLYELFVETLVQLSR